MSSENLTTRERILQVTWTFFEQRGASFTIDEVAEAAGVSRQAVYLHFGSRAGLFIATVRHQDELHGIEARFAAAMDQPSSEEMLQAALEVWFDYIPVISKVVEALNGAAQLDPDARSALSDRSRAQREGMALGVRRIETEGALNPMWSASEATDLLWSLVHISTWNHLVDECGWTPERFIKSRIEIVRHTLLAEPRRAEQGTTLSQSPYGEL